MMKRILLVAVVVIVGVPLLVTAWFYIGGIEMGDTSSPDDADLLWTAPDVADEDNAFIAIMAATNLINCATLGTNSWDKADMSFVSGYANICWVVRGGTGGSCVCTRVRSLSLRRRGGGSPMTAKCRRRLMRLFRSIFLQFPPTLGRKTASPSTTTRQLVSCGRSASREISITPNCLLRSQSGFAVSLAEMWITTLSVSTANR